ncbi:MAG: serine protease, partial [Candidatus Lambdaproteobacteria bacterium]|nr:serine protease [Candidatus Lambdaproteobacteria bacterium]
ALGDGWRTGGGGRIERYVQAELHPPPGFAGAAVVTEDGQVAGLLAPALVRGATVVLPGETLTRLVASLLSGGTTRRGYLGVNTYPAPLPAALATEVRCEGGLVVVAVQPGSPAERGGVMLGDVLLALDGRPVRHIADLLDYLDGDRVGSEAAVRLLRAGKALELRVVVGARPG